MQEVPTLGVCTGWMGVRGDGVAGQGSRVPSWWTHRIGAVMVGGAFPEGSQRPPMGPLQAGQWDKSSSRSGGG